MGTFSEEYFQEEWREGFFIESMMKRAWAAEMEVLEEIDRICKKHKIQYFADSGTLLGAVRHQGFIPWDDDIDIAMKRMDYQRFMQVAPGELPEGWVLCNPFITKEWELPFSRLINSHKVNFTQEHLDRFHGCPYVVGVDIFPLDNKPDDEEEAEMIYCLMKIIYGTILAIQNKEIEEAERLIKDIENMLNVTVNREGNVLNQLFCLVDQLGCTYLEDETEEVALWSWWAYMDKVRNYKRSWFSDSEERKFEHMMLPIPVGYDSLLRVIYGDDYMVPQRIDGYHDYPFYKKQEELLRARGDQKNSESRDEKNNIFIEVL